MSAQWRLHNALTALQAGYQRLHDADADMDLPALPDAAEQARDAVLAVARAAREADALADMARKMAQDTTARAKRFETRAEQLRGLLLAGMDALKERKIEAPDLTLSMRPGTPGVIVTDEAALPEEYWRIKRDVDKAALRDALKQGVIISGAELTNGMPGVQIRSN